MLDYEKKLFDQYNGENSYDIELQSKKDEKNYWENITEKELNDLIRGWIK